MFAHIVFKRLLQASTVTGARKMIEAGLSTAVNRLVLAGVVGLAAIASILSIGDNALRTEFNTALSSNSFPSEARTHGTAPHQQQVAGSEDYWLGDASTSHATPAAWNREDSIAVGDRLALTMKDTETVLEVVSVKTGPAGLLNFAGSGAAHATLPLLVTLQPVGGNGRTLHLIVEGDDGLSGFTRVSQRAHDL